MVHRNLWYNVSAVLLIFCLCLIPAAAADEAPSAGGAPRSFADVPPWISAGLGIKTSAEGGYFVNENPPEESGGFSYGGWADSVRDASDVPAWILAVAGVSGVAVFAFASLHFLPLFLGRTREISPSPVRDSVLAAIRDHPGLPASVLREQTGLHHATLRYHLTVLERELRIVTRRSGHIYYYFPNGSTLSYADTIRITLCQNPTTEKILAIIETEPGISGTVLSARAEIAPGTLTWHLGRLEKNHLITVSRTGRGMRIFPHE